MSDTWRLCARAVGEPLGVRAPMSALLCLTAKKRATRFEWLLERITGKRGKTINYRFDDAPEGFKEL